MKRLFYVSFLCGFVACNGKGGNGNSNGDDSTIQGPKSMTYSIVGTYPHDTSSFTEGLLIYKGDLYESTGEYW